jgi:hypothetical protein
MYVCIGRNISQVASLDSADGDPEGLCCMLQSLYRTLPCIHGYKFFVEIRDSGMLVQR